MMLTTKLENNRYSKAHTNAQKVTDQEWFAMLNKLMYMWDRRDEKSVSGHVNVDKYFELEAAVKKFGGAITDKKLDKHAGKEWVVIKEPKHLTKNSDAKDINKGRFELTGAREKSGLIGDLLNTYEVQQSYESKDALDKKRREAVVKLKKVMEKIKTSKPFDDKSYQAHQSAADYLMTAQIKLNSAKKNAGDLQQLISFLKSELSASKYWSKPKGDSAESDWESYGKQVIQDSMPEIKMGKTPVSEVTSAVKDLYLKMWKSKKQNGIDFDTEVKEIEKILDRESKQGKTTHTGLKKSLDAYKKAESYLQKIPEGEEKDKAKKTLESIKKRLDGNS